MEHVDEGTIHAWLDGALPVGEGERIEAHVASCTQCAAAVAEARGLIAASSRILSALDDVPAAVVPRRVTSDDVADLRSRAARNESSSVHAPTRDAADAAGAADAGRRAGARARRSWWQRPQFAAAAGIAFMAVALTLVWERSPSRTLAPVVSDAAQEQSVSPAATSGAAPTTAPSVASSAPPAASLLADESAPAIGDKAPSAATRGAGTPSAPNQLAVKDPTPGASQAATTPTRREEAKRLDSLPSRGAAVVGASALASRGREELSVESRRANEAVQRVTAAPVAPPAPALAVIPSRDVADRAVQGDTSKKRQATVLSADAITRAEKERLAGELDVARRTPAPAGERASSFAKSTSVAATTGEVAPAAATPATLAGCYQLQRTTDARNAGLGEVMRLVASGAGEDNARPAYVAQEVTSTADRSAADALPWRWTLNRDGGFTLVRGSGVTAQRFPVRIDGAALPSGTFAATRITCPSR